MSFSDENLGGQKRQNKSQSLTVSFLRLHEAGKMKSITNNCNTTMRIELGYVAKPSYLMKSGKTSLNKTEQMHRLRGSKRNQIAF